MISNIGIIGCGGRENALGKAIKKNDTNIKLFYAGNHNNIGLDQLGGIFENIDIENPEFILNWAKKINLELVIIGPEKPLECGLVNLLEDNNIVCLGPRKEFALLESSKLFCRKFLTSIENKFQIKLNPDYFSFDNIMEFKTFLESYDKKIVIKRDSLCGGKGVLVMDEHFNSKEECYNICHEYFSNNQDFHIEEKLEGEEFSLISITDGINIKHFPPIQDYKRAYEDNKGPNTGGMGCIMNCLDFLTQDDIINSENINEIVSKNISEYLKTDKSYKGILYGSFIKTSDSIKLIEYNCRFGDPEIIPLLENMKSSFLDICNDYVNQSLNNDIIFDNIPTITKYIVPEGYPKLPMKNHEFYVHNIDNSNIIWANCEKNNNHYIQLGSRIFAYTLKDTNISNIYDEINSILSKVQGRLFFRKDIGLNTFNNNVKSKYKESGVDIDVGNDIVNEIKEYIKLTENKSVISNYGGFNGMIEHGDNILVSSMDGVGTKSIFIKDILGTKGFESLGIDLVSHCINDILVSGAEPLFFLDYFASSKLCPNEVVNFVKGISLTCKKYGVVLAGGETAEMPNVYNKDHSDLVGTIIGTLKKNEIINSRNDIKKGDIILGLESNGLHTNGYSLIRKLLKIAEEKQLMPNKEVINMLCNPHKCYLNDIKKIQSKIKINGLCHITGGGFIDNPPRILPDNLNMKLNEKLLFRQCIYDWIKSLNYISEDEMLRVFNCGFGMLVFISSNDFEKIKDSNYTLLGKVV